MRIGFFHQNGSINFNREVFMKRVNILDCTLRDGAYLIDSQFGNTAIKGIIEGLTESGIDVIECGF